MEQMSAKAFLRQKDEPSGGIFDHVISGSGGADL